MAKITPYVRGQYPIIEGNDRVYFDTEFRKIQDCLRAVVASLGLGDLGSALIAGGIVTISQVNSNPINSLFIDTESAAASDDVDTINWTGGGNGQLVTMWAVNDARTVVLKDSTGNLNLAGDMTLDSYNDNITLQYFTDGWWEIARSAIA
jgi:hypothetical protein